MHVRLIETGDDTEWLRLRHALWPDTPVELHRAEMAIIRCHLAEMPVFVAVRETGGLCAFLEASLHPSAEGCETHPVGYLEGWYVDPDVRRRGVGRVLVEMAEAWAILYGCQEMASDCVLDNRPSQEAHQALGYQETERLIHYRKSLHDHTSHSRR
jgi:aminoglycoside 6'-N-acetyltransferase I